jgi:hypothetical protein
MHSVIPTTSLRNGPSRGMRGFPVPTVGGAAPSDSQSIEALVSGIRVSEAMQLERIQAVVDGAILAVEQVQDVRLDVLETPAEATVSDLVFDMLVGLCFMGVGAALAPITKSIAKELVQVASWYGRMPDKFLGKTLRSIARMASTDFAEKYGYGDIDPAKFATYNAYVRKVLRKSAVEKAEKGLEKGVDFAKDKVKEGAKTGGSMHAGGEEDGLAPADSPGVAILGAAQSYASAQRAAIAAHHAGFEAVVRSNPGEDLLGIVTQAVDRAPLTADVIQIRDQNKIVFEAAIWAKLFGFDEGKTQAGAPSIGNASILPGVKKQLSAYWRRRFARAIEQWMTGLIPKDPRGSPIRGGVDLGNYGYKPGDTSIHQGAFGNANQQSQESGVIRFFVAVTNDIQTLAGQGLDSGIEVTRKPTAKD